MQDNSARRQLESYPVQLVIATRFSDTDQLAHVNNVAVVDFYQEGRLTLHHELDRAGYRRAADSRTLVAHQHLDYLAEITYPGNVTVGVGISRIGNSSYTVAMALFQAAGCVGLAETVMVHANATGSAPVPAQMRALLEERMLHVAAR